MRMYYPEVIKLYVFINENPSFLKKKKCIVKNKNTKDDTLKNKSENIIPFSNH